MSMVDKEKLARLAQALDDRADNKVAQEADRAAQAEADIQAHSEETRDMLGGKSLRYLTQAEYDILSDEEKNNENVIYYIIDIEDRMHDHYNKETLDLIDDELINNLGRGQLLETSISNEEGWYRIAQVDSEAGVEGSCLCQIQISVSGDEVHSNVIANVGVSHTADIVLQQLGMVTYEYYRHTKIRVVNEHTGDYIKAFIEIYLTHRNSNNQHAKIQIIGDSSWKLVEPVIITESVDESVYRIKEMTLVPGKIVGEFAGSIESANQLSEAIDITVGERTKSFDGSADLSFTLSEIGAAPRSSEDLTTENKVVIDAINELDADLNVVEDALNGYKIWVGTTEELNAIDERDAATLYFEISDSVDYVNINAGVEEVNGVATTNIIDESMPAYNGGEPPVYEELILVSPRGFKFKLTVDDHGHLTTERVD